MATRDELMRAGRRARLERANAKALARECKVCREYRDKPGAHYVEYKTAIPAYLAWLAEGLADDVAVEYATVTVVCYHLKGAK